MGMLLMGQLVPVHAGHHDVQHRQVHRVGAGQLQGGGAVGRAQHLVSAALQIQPHQIGDVLIVLGNQNGVCHEKPPRRKSRGERTFIVHDAPAP